MTTTMEMPVGWKIEVKTRDEDGRLMVSANAGGDQFKIAGRMEEMRALAHALLAACDEQLGPSRKASLTVTEWTRQVELPHGLGCRCRDCLTGEQLRQIVELDDCAHAIPLSSYCWDCYQARYADEPNPAVPDPADPADFHSLYCDGLGCLDHEVAVA